MLENNKCIVAYGINQFEKNNLSSLGYRIVQITPEMTKMTIEEVLSGLRFQTFNPNPIQIKIIILNNFPDNEIRQNVSKIRSIVSDCIMAVPTPANKKWAFDDLARHLIEERNWHLSQQKG